MKVMHRTSPRKGFFLIVTLMLALALTTIVASFIALSTTSVKTTEASFTHHSTLLPGEEGLDKAFGTLTKYAEVLRGGSLTFNPANQTAANAIWSNAGWSGAPPGPLSRDINGYNPISLGNGRTAKVRVKVFDVPTATSGSPLLEPYMVAEVTYQPAGVFGGTGYTRQLYAKAGWGPLFPIALLARHVIDLNGSNVSVDSFKDTPVPVGPPGPNTQFSRDFATVASLSPNLGVNGGNAIVYGFVATGGDANTDLSFGPNAHIWGTQSTPVSTGAYLLKGADPARTSGGFSINDDLLQAIPYVNGGSDVTGVWSGVPDVNGVLTITGSLGLGSTVYKLPAGGLDVGSGAVKKVVIKGNVKLLLGAAGLEGQTTFASAKTLPAVKVSGTGSLEINTDLSFPSSSLTIFTPGDVSISGGGVVNNTPTGVQSQATNFTVFGVNLNGSNLASIDKTKMQTMDFTGNAANIGLVHAPNAIIKMGGGGSSGIMIGAIIAYDITAGGGINFHYDEKLLLQQFPDPLLAKWVELKGTSKIAFP